MKRATAETRTPKRRNDPAGMRARVLDAAAALFQNRGYHATGMRDVMSATGLSPGSLHHHFPTKESLAIGVISERVATTVRESWIDPVRTAASLRKGVVGVFSDIIRGIDARKAVSGCPLNNLAMELSLTNARMRDALRSIFVEWQNALEARIRKTRHGRCMKRDEIASTAAFIVASYSGAMNLAKATQSSEPLRVARRTLSRWLVEQRLD